MIGNLYGLRVEGEMLARDNQLIAAAQEAYRERITAEALAGQLAMREATEMQTVVSFQRDEVFAGVAAEPVVVESRA